jgi:hypothetical protein
MKSTVDTQQRFSRLPLVETVAVEAIEFAARIAAVLEPEIGTELTSR